MRQKPRPGPHGLVETSALITLFPAEALAGADGRANLLLFFEVLSGWASRASAAGPAPSRTDGCPHQAAFGNEPNGGTAS